MQLNIWTWNVNGIKNKINLVRQLLLKHNIDILFLTETKIQKKDEYIIFENYKCIWNSNQNSYYHGVAFIYKSHLNIELINNILPHSINIEYKLSQNIKEIKNIELDIKKAHYTEGRILVIKCDNIILVGTYVPNAGIKGFQRLAYRTLVWDKDLYHYLTQLKAQYTNVIWLGDLNVAIKDNDFNRKNIAGTTIEERENIKEFIIDWIDSWDLKNNYTKCSQRSTYAFPLRLDYVICSSSLKDNIISSQIDQDYKGSDHYPMGTIIKI